MSNKCYSLTGEDFTADFCDLTDELEENELGVGTEYFEGDRADVGVKDYVNSHGIESLLEQFDDWVYGDVGEIADSCFTNASKEAKDELKVMIQRWAEVHVRIPYWKVQNVIKKTITEEDLC